MEKENSICYTVIKFTKSDTHYYKCSHRVVLTTRDILTKWYTITKEVVTKLVHITRNIVTKWYTLLEK
jgi:hypothetical protein